ncbi:MAG: NAD(P)H-binding protein, partial [Propionibacteriales bacterium]|nr:NAD(P)H-binding protein [Propionibacteriales bacterium]
MLIYVTGATGTVGRRVLPHLIDAGAEVRALTRNPSSAHFPDSVEPVQGDLDQPEALRASLNGADVLYL